MSERPARKQETMGPVPKPPLGQQRPPRVSRSPVRIDIPEGDGVAITTLDVTELDEIQVCLGGGMLLISSADQ